LFTGIVEETGSVDRLDPRRLTVKTETVLEGMKLGDSISINGTCLTVVDLGQGTFSADLSPETLRRTSLGSLSEGGLVNLERAVAVGDRMGGHIVQGHVDGTGRISSIRSEDDCIIVRIRAPKRLMTYIVEKGFIAVDGISLTVVQKGPSSFLLSVIPYTLQYTNLRVKAVGDPVNLEADIVAKYVESLLQR